MNYKNLAFLIILFTPVKELTAQATGNFKLICDTNRFVFKKPFIHFFSDRVDEQYIDLKKIDPKTNTYPFEFNIPLSRVLFIELVNTPLLVFPNAGLKGTISNYGESFQINDTGNINHLFVRYQKEISSLKKEYKPETTYKDFLTIYDSLKDFILKEIEFINSVNAIEKYKLNREMKTALTDYLFASLGSFALYPIYNNASLKNKITALIHRDIRMLNPNNWMQIQIAKGFLKNYFLQIVIPYNKNDIYKSLDSDPLFINLSIKKYLVYNYYNSLLESDTIFLSTLKTLKNIDEIEKKIQLTSEDKTAFLKLKYRVQLSGNSIKNLIAKQSFQTSDLKELSFEKKKLLINSDKVLLYFWASWCRPCIETLQKLTSDHININGTNYRIIFLSIDAEEKKWSAMFAKNKILQPNNSFRINNVLSSPFHRAFTLFRMPRIISIEKGILSDQNFSPLKLKNSTETQ